MILWKKVSGNSSFLLGVLLKRFTSVSLLVISPLIFHIITLAWIMQTKFSKVQIKFNWKSLIEKGHMGNENIQRKW